MTEYGQEVIAAGAGTVLPYVPERCVIILDQDLPTGRLVNAAAVVALTIGQRHPVLVGEPLVDGSGYAHPGLIPIGIAVLAAPQMVLAEIRRGGLAIGCDVIDFPVEGQQTKDYQTFREAVAGLPPAAIKYVGVALVGRKKEIRKLVSELDLLQ